MVTLDQCHRELLSSEQTANIIITSVNSKHPTWLLCDQYLLYPMLLKSQVRNYLKVVEAQEAVSFLIPSRVVHNSSVERDGMLHLHFYRFTDEQERPLIKLSYLCPQTEKETSTTEWLSRYEDYEEVFPSLVSHMESKLGCTIEILTNHQDLKPEYLSTLRMYSPRLIIYRVGDQTLDYWGQLKATAGIEAEVLLSVIDEVICKLLSNYPGTALYSDEAVAYITDELEPYLEPIDLTQINYPFVNG